jgi:glycosyltransferase involved in cell wall biosynthesis
MDGFTYEEFEPEELTFVTILLPPLVFEGTTLKGLYAAPGVDAIHLLLPGVSEQFISIANSRWASYPWSSHADGYFVCCNNHDRIKYFKNKPSSRKHITLIPQQTADHLNECEYYPRGEIQKDIDILVVARVDSTKNLGSLAQAIAALHKMGRRHRVVWAQAESLQDAWARPDGRQLLTEMEHHLGRLEDHLEPCGAVSNAEMRLLFARAKVFFLPSLVEGNSRARAEALCSNVPVVAFNHFNLAARGDEPVLPERAGLAMDLEPQDAARGLANAVANYGDFAPRESYLRTGGRMNFF